MEHTYHEKETENITQDNFKGVRHSKIAFLVKQLKHFNTVITNIW